MTTDPIVHFELGQKLLANRRFGTPEFDQGFQHLLSAANAGLVDAQVALGHVYSQVHVLPDAAAQAVRWYQDAAKQGHPAAQDRLADLYMLGWGVTRSDTEALNWYRRTADQYFAMAQCNLAYMLTEGIGTAPDQVEATTLYLRAAAQGDPRAYFNLGLRYASGLGAARNPVHACAWMLSAVRVGYPTSDKELATIEHELTPAERVSANETARLIEQNFEALQYRLGRVPGATESAELYREVVDANFAALDIAGLALDPQRRGAGNGTVDHAEVPHQPAPAQMQVEQPRIFTVDEFVSRGECAHLLYLASANMTPAQQGTADTLSQEQTAFTGAAAYFPSAMCDAVTRNIERRIASAFSLAVNQVEPVSVLRYCSGDRYAPHVDYFDTARLEQNRNNGDRSGQRIASFLVYLVAPEQGGETHYLKLERKIAGRARMALCHYNLDESGNLNPITLHCGDPVIKGEKWLARTTLRERSLF